MVSFDTVDLKLRSKALTAALLFADTVRTCCLNPAAAIRFLKI